MLRLISASMIPMVLCACAMGTHGRKELSKVKRLGLYVEDGVLLKDGNPYRGIGMQYHDPFQRRLLNAKDTTYREGFNELATYGVPFVRFMACGFFPDEMKLYFEDRKAYFTIMDDIVATAERAGVGLIPGFFWWHPCVPDLVGEPVGAWGNPDSKTHAFMKTYTREMVTRYKDAPAIWAWEFGNEYNLAIDLPKDKEYLPWAVPERGTPAKRTEQDHIAFDDLVTALRVFGETVREYDPHSRLVLSGNAIPRPAARHLHTEGAWKPDSREEFVDNLNAVDPAPLDGITIHVYPEARQDGYFGQDYTEFDELLRLAMDAAEKSRRILFVGEFGAPDDEKRGGRENAREENEKLFEAIVDAGVPLASYWVYDFAFQDDFINVTSTNHRAYVLDMVRDANNKLRGKE
jgi:hypothetical protein